jgi:hypothetical protein
MLCFTRTTKRRLEFMFIRQFCMAHMSMSITSPRENIYQHVLYTYVHSWIPTQLEHGKEKKLYEELETGRTVVAPCNTRDCTGHICESEQKLSVAMEHQR